MVTIREETMHDTEGIQGQKVTTHTVRPAQEAGASRDGARRQAYKKPSTRERPAPRTTAQAHKQTGPPRALRAPRTTPTRCCTTQAFTPPARMRRRAATDPPVSPIAPATASIEVDSVR